jgi:hypothetical protein
MKFQLECEVESLMKLPQPVLAEWDGKQLMFAANDQGYLARVTITAPVRDPTAIRTSAANAQNGTLVVKVSSEPGLTEELIKDLQAVESIFGYQFNLTRIAWRFAKVNILCDTPEEKEQVEVTNWCIKTEICDIPTEFDANQFHAAIESALRCRDLASTMAFYREGLNDLRDLRYINAFFNFYFVLEGLYSNGKWKTDAVKVEFKRSKILVHAISYAIQKGIPRPWRLDRPDVLAMLNKMRKKLDVDGVIHLLAYTRGDLHHFAKNSKTVKASPLTQDNYESLSRFTMEICRVALFEEMNARTSVPASA